MTHVTISGSGSDVDQVIANLREKLDEQFGHGEWRLVGVPEEEDDPSTYVGFIGGNPSIEIQLSPGGQAASVTVTMVVTGERLSTLALPRGARA